MLKHVAPHKQPEISAKRTHTLLYKVQPEGRGSGQVESLYSLLQRLAYEHSLAPNRLVCMTLANDPDIRATMAPSTTAPTHSYDSNVKEWNWGSCWTWGKDTPNLMIGAGLAAMRWANALEIASGNQSLDECTLRGLHLQISTNKLVVAEARICLDCLQQDLTTGRMPYERLLWRMRPVSCCPIHRKALLSPQCGKQRVKHKDKYLRIDYCGACKQCGSLGFSCSDTTATPCSEADLWRAEQCAQLLVALSSNWHQLPGKMKKLMKAQVEATGGVQAFAAKVGIPKSDISRWLNGTSSRLGIDQLLDIAWVKGVSLPELLQGNWVEVNIPKGDRSPLRARRQIKKINHDQLRQAMIDAIAHGKNATQVARTMQVSTKSMKSHAALYEELQAHAISRKQATDEHRRSMALDEAAGVATQLLAAGEKLSLRNAMKLTGNSWYPTELRAQCLRVIAHVLENAEPPMRGRISAATFGAAIAVARRLQSSR